MTDFKQYIKKEEADEVDINKLVDGLRSSKTDSKTVTKEKELLKPKEDVVFTKEDRETLVEKHLKGKVFNRRERKLVTNFEHDPYISKQNTTLILAVIGVMFVFLLYSYAPDSGWVTVIVILLGCMFFIPIGALLGWMFDPYIRCKIFRKLTKRNWGILNFVSGGNKIITKMRDFDQGLIWRGNECWILTKNKLCQLTKNGNLVNTGQVIDVENITTIVDTVPVLYVDVDSMEPLSLSKEGRERVDPEELGSTLKAWEANVKAKVIGKVKNLDKYVIVAMVAAVVAAGLAFMAYDTSNQIQEQMTALINQVNNIAANLPPT